GIIRCRLDEHRNAEIGQAQGVGNGPLFAEVWQRNHDAVNPVAVFLEEFSTMARFFAGFDRTILALLRSQGHYIHTRAVERTNHLLAAALCQMIRKESAVP